MGNFRAKFPQVKGRDGRTLLVAVAGAVLLVVVGTGCATEPTALDDDNRRVETEVTSDEPYVEPDVTPDEPHVTPDEPYVEPDVPESAGGDVVLLADSICADGVTQYYENGRSGISAADALWDTARLLIGVGSSELDQLIGLVAQRAELTASSNVAMDQGSVSEVIELGNSLDENSAQLEAVATQSGMPSCAELAGL